MHHRPALADARTGRHPASQTRDFPESTRADPAADHGDPLTTFLDQTTDLARPRPELDTEATAADLASLELGDGRGRPRARRGHHRRGACPGRGGKAADARCEAGRHPGSRHRRARRRARRPPRHRGLDAAVPPRDRPRAAPHGRGGGRPRQGDRARRADPDRAVDGHPRPPRVDAPRHRGQGARQASGATPCHSAQRLTGSCAARCRPTTRRAISSSPPRASGSPSAIAAAHRRGPRELLERARNLRAVYNERLDAEAFLALLDWVHAVGCRAGRPRGGVAHGDAVWARDEVAIPALRRWVEAGHEADAARGARLPPGR